MSHTYVVSSASYIPGLINPVVTIVGTVDGISVTVTCTLFLLQGYNTSGGLAAVKTFVASLMLNQSAINQPPAPVASIELPTGTFVQ